MVMEDGEAEKVSSRSGEGRASSPSPPRVRTQADRGLPHMCSSPSPLHTPIHISFLMALGLFFDTQALTQCEKFNIYMDGIAKILE